MNRIRVAILLGCLSLLAIPAVTQASTSQEALFQDDAQLTGRDLATQLKTLDTLENLGVDQIHAIVYWNFYLSDPNRSKRPSGDPTDSTNTNFYSQDRWDLLDSLVVQARARGFKLLLTPASTTTGGSIGTPKWALGRGKEIKPKEAGKFYRAVFSRYNGNFTDTSGPTAGTTLPKVKDWSAHNEPNQGGWIRPQFKGGKPNSPAVYRELYLAAQKGLKKEGHRSSRLYLGETAPLGDPKNKRKANTAMSPGTFYAALACRDEDLGRLSRKDRKKLDCKGFKRLKTSGINHHFYTKGRGQGPTFAPNKKFQKGWYPIGKARGFVKFIDKVARKRGWRKGLRIYNTEFGYQSNPTDRKSGVRLSQQGQSINESEYIQYRQSRIRSYAQYLLNDDPCSAAQSNNPGQLLSSSKCAGFQTGLRFFTGEDKPALGGYAMPIVVVRTKSSSKQLIFGASLGRGSGRRTEITKDGNVVATVTGNKRGYFREKVSGKRTSTYQLRDEQTGATSRETKASSKRIK